MKKYSRDKRMAYTMRRSMRAMAITTASTSVAFLANFFSPIMPLKSFGAFAGTIVIVNYFQVLLIFPCAIVYYEDAIQHQFAFLSPNKVNPAESRRKGGFEFETFHEIFGNFFAKTWSTQLQQNRAYVMVLTALLYWVAVEQAKKLGPITKPERLIVRDHSALFPFQIQNDVFQGFYEDGPHHELIEVDIVWGIKEVDRKTAKLWEPEEYGELVRDGKFDPSTPAAQVYLYNFCSRLRNSRMIVEPSEVQCWIEDFFKYTRENNVAFPIEQRDDFYESLRRFSKTPEGKHHSDYRGFYVMNGQIAFMKVRTQGLIRKESNVYVKFPEHARWEAYIQRF